MVTHDVDEAILLADRVVMMTNGPRAKVGKILEINLPRPRTRTKLLEHLDCYRLRWELLSFLKECLRRSQDVGAPSPLLGAQAGVAVRHDPTACTSGKRSAPDLWSARQVRSGPWQPTILRSLFVNTANPIWFHRRRFDGRAAAESLTVRLSRLSAISWTWGRLNSSMRSNNSRPAVGYGSPIS